MVDAVERLSQFEKNDKGKGEVGRGHKSCACGHFSLGSVPVG